MSIDLARRVHDHNFHLDPYVRSLLDTDFYKILMACFIWKWYPDVGVTFRMKNRTRTVRLSREVPMQELHDQLAHVMGLRFTEPELIWLQGNSFYGQKNIFPGPFIDALRGLRLPPFELDVDPETGDYELTFTGTWLETTLWEIYALAVVNEARSRAAMRGMSQYQLRVLYAEPDRVYRRAKSSEGKLWKRETLGTVFRQRCAHVRCAWSWRMKRITNHDRRRLLRSQRSLDAAAIRYGAG
jgi:nicotinate phosphoribosyltransferase